MNSQESSWKRILAHFVVPAFIPALFFGIASTPVSLLGCRTRGLLALLVTLLGALAALAAAARGIWEKRRNGPYAVWWLVSSLILVIPAVYIVAIAH